MARVTSNLKTSDMMRKGVNPETVSALATLWRARFEELTARAQEEAAEGEDTRCVAHVFRYLQQSSQGSFQVFKTPKVTSLCLLLPLSTTQSLGEAQQQRPPTHLPLNGSMPTVLIRRMASETSAVIWHATFVQKLIPVRILNVFFARARCPSCAISATSCSSWVCFQILAGVLQRCLCAMVILPNSCCLKWSNKSSNVSHSVCLLIRARVFLICAQLRQR